VEAALDMVFRFIVGHSTSAEEKQRLQVPCPPHPAPPSPPPPSSVEAALGLAFRFIVGHSASAEEEQMLQAENSTHGDLLRVDVDEGYLNLNHKTLVYFTSLFKLYEAEFYVKADDDIYLIPERLSSLIARPRDSPRTYLGCFKRGSVITDPKKRWFEPKSELLGSHYFAHAFGSIYSLSYGVVQTLNAIPTDGLSMFTNEDVSVGAWMLAFDVQHENLRSCDSLRYRRVVRLARPSTPGPARRPLRPAPRPCSPRAALAAPRATHGGPLAAPAALLAAPCGPLAAPRPSRRPSCSLRTASCNLFAAPCCCLPCFLRYPASARPACCAAMASLSVLAFDHEGHPIQFDTWLDDLQLYLVSGFRDSVSLFDHTSGAAPSPPATADRATRSQWLTRDAAARLAIYNHLPLVECAHFGQHRTAQALYNAVVARYSLPTSAAIGRRLMPYLFPELSAFATVEDLVSRLCTSDARYRVAAPTEFLDRNQPPMFITIYFIVTRLPDSLRSVRDHFLSLDPTVLIVDLHEQHLLEAETSVVAVGASRGTPRTPFFEGCSPSPLAPSYASAAVVDVLGADDVGAASASAKRRSSKV
ncbi:unnamed protein product, partial [Closterium sp. NIES-54]